MPKPCCETRVPPTKRPVPSTNTTSISQIGRTGLINIHLHRLRRIEPTTGKCNRVSYPKVHESNTEKCGAWQGQPPGETCPRREENGMHYDICSHMTTAIFAASLSFRPLTCCGFGRIWQSIRGCIQPHTTKRRNECSRDNCTMVSWHFTSAMICKDN
jgi:hypothetical protein